MQARLETERELRRAVAENQLEVAYQPLVELKTGRTLGFEALLRWNHPTRGQLSPFHFIPLAEETGLIREIGAWCLRQACRDAAGLPGNAKIAVNLSPVQLKSDNLVEIVMAALVESGLSADRLELEITESALLEDDERIIGHLYRLREAGIRIVLDDFGTGYSSLNYLRRFPFNKIKIDKVFVSEAITRSDCATIIISIIDLATRLGMSTTAEGIETEEQVALLNRLGSIEGQGYFFGRPGTILAALARLGGSKVVPIGNKLTASSMKQTG
jgi:EAL domain-containing protein (putative c-di-GMP-specific phosphodiesterase class I)